MITPNGVGLLEQIEEVTEKYNEHGNWFHFNGLGSTMRFSSVVDDFGNRSERVMNLFAFYHWLTTYDEQAAYVFDEKGVVCLA